MNCEPAERFLRKVGDPTDEGCLPWLAGGDGKGYGVFWLDGAMLSAQRAAYRIFVGPVPAGMVVDHICHNESGCRGGPTCRHRRCVNPAHLEPVTASENLARGCVGYNAFKTHCPRGHEYDRVRPDGRRKCSRCQRASERAFKQRRRELALGLAVAEADKPHDGNER